MTRPVPAVDMTEPDPALQAALQRALLQLREVIGARPVSIFIDPLLGDPLAAHPDTVQCLASGAAVVQSLPRIHADVDAARAPYLIHAPSEPAAERLINASVDIALREATNRMPNGYRGRCVCAWLPDDTAPQATAARLARSAAVIAPHGRAHPFRYWDPRVRWHLPRVLPPGHWQRLRSRLGNWHNITPMGQLEGLPGSSEAAASDETRDQRLRFDDAAWGRLKDVTLCNKVLALCPQWGIALSNSLPPLVEQAINDCRSHGFDTEQDILVYCACALTAHPRFDRHPAVSAALKEARAMGASLQHALQGFDNSFWQQLSASRQSQNP